jgi:Winged helix DNA-binding domain
MAGVTYDAGEGSQADPRGSRRQRMREVGIVTVAGERDRRDVALRRLQSQHAVAPLFEHPADVVVSLCAVQAQEYRSALWGIGLRTFGTVEADVERAIADRSIVRTWPMRGTLHFVAAADVRWMLRLLTPRIVARTAARRRALDLDAATLARSATGLEAALAGGRALTRGAAYRALERCGIAVTGQRGIHILVELAMRGTVCLGPREGRQPTFVLLDEWIPRSRLLDRDEALGELARRYFTSHGPATPADFAWWSGLSLGDARRGLEVAGKTLTQYDAGSATVCWVAASGPAPRAKTVRTRVGHLLPAFDELTVAYRDRSAFLDPAYAVRARNGIFSPVLLIDGRIVGTWRRRATRDGLAIAAELFEPAVRGGRRALDTAAARYARFYGLPATLEITEPGTPGGGKSAAAPEPRATGTRGVVRRAR